MTAKLFKLVLLIALTVAPAMSMWAQEEDQPRGPRPERDGEQPRLRDHGPGRPDQSEPDPSRFQSKNPLPPERVQEAIAALREMHGENQPEWMKDLEELAQQDPAEAARRLSRFPNIIEVIDAHANRPEEFKLYIRQSTLMRQIFPLIKEYREAQREENAVKLEEIRPQIRECVRGLLENRVELKRMEIERIRLQLKEAEEDLAKIENSSEELIEQKVKEMLEQRPRRPRPDEGQGDRPEGPKPERKPSDQGLNL